MNYQNVVTKYREIYDHLSGPERAWNVINSTCLEIKTGWGLIKKPSGMQFNGYSIDCIVNLHSGEFVDCLLNSELEAVPTWQNRAASPDELTRWAPPVENGMITPTPTPTPTPVPAPVPVKTQVSMLVSANGCHQLCMQDDGNLVIYDGGKPIWASGTNH